MDLYFDFTITKRMPDQVCKIQEWNTPSGTIGFGLLPENVQLIRSVNENCRIADDPMGYR